MSVSRIYAFHSCNGTGRRTAASFDKAADLQLQFVLRYDSDFLGGSEATPTTMLPQHLASLRLNTHRNTASGGDYYSDELITYFNPDYQQQTINKISRQTG